MLRSRPTYSGGRWSIIMQSSTPEHGLLRLKQIIAPHGPLPLSKSTFYAGIKSGRFPAPRKLGPKISVWTRAEIRKLIEEGIPQSGLATKSGVKS
jgi:predicted DNA-binding transcriptional regulator AlpA